MKSAKTACVGAALIITAAVMLIVPASAHAQKKQRRGSAESEAILPQIDVIQVKENADEALRTAREIRRELERLDARITQLDNRVILLSEEVANISSAKVEELESRLALLTEAYKDLFVKAQVMENQLARIPVPPPPPPTPNKSTFTPSSAGEVLLASPEYELYQSGLRLYNGRGYAQAIKVFNECMDKYPGGAYKDNAQYWIGECYYQMAQMDKAVEAYRKVLVYPNSSKADAAQFKIGLAHQKLGQTEKAKAEFRRLVERYPASDYAEKAKKYIGELK